MLQPHTWERPLLAAGASLDVQAVFLLTGTGRVVPTGAGGWGSRKDPPSGLCAFL